MFCWIAAAVEAAVFLSDRRRLSFGKQRLSAAVALDSAFVAEGLL